MRQRGRKMVFSSEGKRYKGEKIVLGETIGLQDCMVV